MKRIIAIWAVMGMVYLAMEGLWRGGWTHIAMLPVGGLCGAAVGGINQIPLFYRCRIMSQSVIGAIIVLCIEFASGCVLNLWLGLEVWDYAGLPGNILGQICLPYAALWLFLMPFAIWLEDTLRYVLWREGEYYTLASVYFDFFTAD